MSWHFLQAEEVVSWDPSCSDGPPDALASLIPMRVRCSLHDSATDSSSPSRFGTTSEHSTATRGEDRSTSFRAASLARTLAAPDVAAALTAHGRAYGSKCSASLARFDLVLSSPKTLRCSALADLIASSKGLPTWGIAFAGVCLELGTSVRRTNEIECGLWPTPTTTGNECSPSMQKWPAHRRMLAALPTPTAKLYGYNRGGAAGRVGKKRPSLETMIGGVNIALREWMMGWPIGWTALGSLGTDRFRAWLGSQP